MGRKKKRWESMGKGMVKGSETNGGWGYHEWGREGGEGKDLGKMTYRPKTKQRWGGG
jgi:hypothetical protein